MALSTEAPSAGKQTAKSSNPPTDPSGPTGRLALWVAETTLDDVPASVRDRAKHLILDGIACALVGAQLPVSRIGVEGVTALDSVGDSPLIGWDGRETSATSAAMVNSSFIQGFELDDYHPLAPLHSNSIILPAMLAAAPRVGRVSGECFLLGAILGYETGPRVGQALGGLDMLSRGWHSGVVFGPIASAAAAGTLYGLDAAKFEDAFGIGATQSCGLMSAMYESMVKRMQHGFASRNGLTAAALAPAGYVGIKRVFERPYGGWLAVFGEGHRTYPEAIYAGLGTLWETERIAVKAYSCMGLLHAAIDAALELRPKVDLSQIQRIEVDMGEAAYAHGGWKAERPLEVIGAQMNVAYAVAVALLDGDVLVEQFTQKRINSDDVWGLIDRTITHHERAYDNLPVDEQLTTQVRLTMKDGTTHAAKVAHPRGTGDRKLTNTEIRDKYAKLTHRTISADRQAAIEKVVLNIEGVDDIAALTTLLTPASSRRSTESLAGRARAHFVPLGPPGSSPCSSPAAKGSAMLTSIDPRTALVLIDLQHGITALPTVHPAEEIVARCAQLADAFRANEKLVVASRVTFARDGGDVIKTRTAKGPPNGKPVPDNGELRTEVQLSDRDIVVTKHNWNAFYGTDLDLELRRRQVTGIVLAGISTSIGVESTARAANERGYQLAIVTDAVTDTDADAHLNSLRAIFPRIAELATTEEILSTLARAE